MTIEQLKQELKDMGCELQTPSPHHTQIRQDGEVLADWWPSKGTTISEGKRGPKCSTPEAFLEWLRSM